MTRTQSELTYLRAAAENATAVGLVIVLYDLLIGDLKAAIAAITKNNIEERSKELKHAFLVLEKLEASLDMEKGGDAATNLARFYATLRSNIMDAHIKVSSEILAQQIQLLFQVRSAWAQVDTPKPEGDSTAVSAPAPTPAESTSPQVHMALSLNA